MLLSDECFLVLEGAWQPPVIQQFLERESVLPVASISRATIWPRTTMPHVPAVASMLNDLADLVESYSPHDLCYHLYVYDRQGVVLEWHDAFADPFYVSWDRVPRERVEAFCDEVNVSFERG